MKKWINKIMIIIGVLLMILGVCNVVNATTKDNLDINNMNINSINQNTLLELIKEETSIDTNNIDIGEALTAYQELSSKYTNEELADIIQEHSKEIEKQGIKSEVIEAGTKILRTVDEKELNKILTEDINVEEIKEKLKNGYTPEEIIHEMQNEMSLTDKLKIGVKLVLTSSIVRITCTVLLVLFIYGTITKWIIFHKAGKHGFAAIIPIYRQMTMFQVCNMTPWWLLLLLIPIIGWIIYAIAVIVSRFKLASSFNRGPAFGFGLLLLGCIFESILAFSNNTKYRKE